MKKLVIPPSLVSESLNPDGFDFYTEVMMKIVQDSPLMLCVDRNISILSEYSSANGDNSMFKTWITLLTNKRYWQKNVEISGNAIKPEDTEERKLIDIADGVYDECQIVTVNKNRFTDVQDEIKAKNHILVDKWECIKDFSHPTTNHFLYRLVDALSRMQERRATANLEDLHNDRLTDYLRTEGYQVADQSRSGKSNKTAGELDLCIRKKSGTIDCIIEALREKSAGSNNNNISKHSARLFQNCKKKLKLAS